MKSRSFRPLSAPLHDPASQLMDMLIQAISQGKLCVVDVSQLRGAQATILSGLTFRRIFDRNQQEFTEANPRTIPTIAVIEEVQDQRVCSSNLIETVVPGYSDKSSSELRRPIQRCFTPGTNAGADFLVDGIVRFQQVLRNVLEYVGRHLTVALPHWLSPLDTFSCDADPLGVEMQS